MLKKHYRGEWAGSSNLREKRDKLFKAHEEFLASDLKKRIDSVPHTPRRKRQPREVIVSLGGSWELKITYAEYVQRGRDFKVITEIY